MRNSKGQFIKGHSAHPETQFKKGQHWRKRRAHWDRDWLIQKYEIEKMSCAEIAELQNCTESNILYWMKKHNIQRRSIKEARKIKHWGMSGKENAMYGVTGKDNPNWKGGITPDRQSLYASQEWKNVVRNVKKRDINKCQKCGVKNSKDNKLHVHHIVGFENKELRTEMNNLILLCKDCHSWVHSNKNTERRFLG